MKNNILHIIFGIVFLVSCTSERSGEDADTPRGSRSLTTVEVLVDGADEHDYVRTARFVVFDNASVVPSVDINELITLEAKDQDSKKFKTILEVSCNPDKMLVVVLNEPPTMNGVLGAVMSPVDLEEMIFLMDESFTPNHTVPSSSGIPMSGVKRKIEVVKEVTSEEKISIERGVARVELWLKKETAVPQARVTTATRVTLENSYAEGFLVTGTELDGTRFQTGTDVENNFGRMLVPDNNYTFVGWNYGESAALELDETPRLVCVFYTPERTCSAPGDADKLVLNMSGISSSDGDRGGQAVLSAFSPEGGGSPQAITELRRNHIYRITGVVKEKTVQFEHIVVPWTEAGQEIIIDPQYFLRVGRDILYVNNTNNSAMITAETNYDRTDRGFPKGILTGKIDYYDLDGRLLDASHGESGWLEVSMSGADGDLSRDVVFTTIRDLSDMAIGYYALVEVKAGNMIKKIRVTRS